MVCVCCTTEQQAQREHGSARTSCSFLSPAGLLSILMEQVPLHVVPRWLTQFVLLCLSSTPLSFYFLRYSSPLPQSAQFCIWHGAALAWRRDSFPLQTPFIISKLPEWRGSFYHKIFYKKGSFQKHLDRVILFSCLLSSLSLLHLVLVFIDDEFSGVGTVFLGSCSICCCGILSLDYMPWKL